jgi:hypothetical protein
MTNSSGSAVPIQKIARQPNDGIARCAIIAPIMPPRGTDTTAQATAILRTRRGVHSEMNAAASGVRPPSPMPVAVRHRNSSPRLRAWALSSEPTARDSRQAMKALLRPTRSPSRPSTTDPMAMPIRLPFKTQMRSARAAPQSATMAGATNDIVCRS